MAQACGTKSLLYPYGMTGNATCWRALRLDGHSACSVPMLTPTRCPPATVRGITARARPARQATSAEREPSKTPRQMVPTYGHRCRHVDTAEGAQGPVTPPAVSPGLDSRRARGWHGSCTARRGRLERAWPAGRRAQAVCIAYPPREGSVGMYRQSDQRALPVRVARRCRPMVPQLW